jgi:hypothetical protein
MHCSKQRRQPAARSRTRSSDAAASGRVGRLDESATRPVARRRLCSATMMQALLALLALLSALSHVKAFSRRICTAAAALSAAAAAGVQAQRRRRQNSAVQALLALMSWRAAAAAAARV